MMFGMKDSWVEQIQQVLRKYDTVQRAVIFGSRAKGTFKQGSDVDLALEGESLDRSTVMEIYDELEEETLVPLFFDVVHLNSLPEGRFRENIVRHGQVFPF